MMKDTKDGQTHFENDGCGEPAHNATPNNQIIEEKADIEQKVAAFLERYVKKEDHHNAGVILGYIIAGYTRSAEQAGYARAMGEAREKLEKWAEEMYVDKNGTDEYLFGKRCGAYDAIQALSSLTPTDNNKEV